MWLAHAAPFFTLKNDCDACGVGSTGRSMRVAKSKEKRKK
jgi:hypothetical protein